MFLRRQCIMGSLVLLWSSSICGRRVTGRLRTVATTRGALIDDVSRGLATLRLVGEKPLNMMGGQIEGTKETGSGLALAEADDNEEWQQSEAASMGSDDPVVAQATTEATPPAGSSHRSKLPKKKRQNGKGSRSKLRPQRSGAPAAPESFDEVMGDGKPIAVGSADESRYPSRDPTETSTLSPQPTRTPSMARTEEPTAAETEQPPLPPNYPTFLPNSADESPASTVAQVGTPVPTVTPIVEPTTKAPSALTTTLTPTYSAQILATEDQAAIYYEFGGGRAKEPNANEIFRLEIATSAFYIGVFAHAFKDNPDTVFSSVVAQVEELLYSANATPPIQIEWCFQVGFDSSSKALPSSEQVLGLIYSDEETLNEYVEIYLHGEDDVWSSVTAVTFKQFSTQGEERSTSVMVEPNFQRTQLEASLMLEFKPDRVEAEPSQEEYDRFFKALGGFFTALLTQAYTGVDDATLATVTSSLIETSFSDQADLSFLQANAKFEVVFSNDSVRVPRSSSILGVMQENVASLLHFLQGDISSSWEEGDAWHDLTSLTIEEVTPIRRTGKGKGKANLHS